MRGNDRHVIPRGASENQKSGSGIGKSVWRVDFQAELGPVISYTTTSNQHEQIGLTVRH